jgi:NDP-sugar pyrophosphorylase family protein
MARPEGQAMKVVILAGGLGTRLGEAARGLPKGMVAVGTQPFLELVVESFTAHGFQDFVLLVGYRGDVIEQHFGDGSSFGARIEYSRDAVPMGTGGAIREARHLLGDPFLLTYGDVLRRFDYDRFVREHSAPCLAVYERISTGNTEIEGDLPAEEWRLLFRGDRFPATDGGRPSRM